MLCDVQSRVRASSTISLFLSPFSCRSCSPSLSLSLFSLPRLPFSLRPIVRYLLPRAPSLFHALCFFLTLALAANDVSRARSRSCFLRGSGQSWLSSWCVRVNAQWRPSSNSRAGNMEEGAVVLR